MARVFKHSTQSTPRNVQNQSQNNPTTQFPSSPSVASRTLAVPEYSAPTLKFSFYHSEEPDDDYLYDDAIGVSRLAAEESEHRFDGTSGVELNFQEPEPVQDRSSYAEVMEMITREYQNY